jgi:DNA-binding HxlR family transcriptional regulator
LTNVLVQGKGEYRVRAGAHALSLLSVPLNVHVLQALAEEPRSLADLRRAAGSPPQTTMRGHLRRLTEAGILERRRQNDFPGSVDYELGRLGGDLMVVAAVLRDWLAASPEGPLMLGSPAAKSLIKALVDGWSTGVVRALAARPFSLTELSSIITGLSYPSLERRLGAMRLAGMIERCTGGGRGTPYKVTDWLRRAIGPLAAAARWERQHLPEETAPIGRIDVESAFLLTLPLLSLPSAQSGVCRLAVESRNGNGESRLAGVMVEVQEGRIVSCVSRLEGDAGAWASGSAASWLRAVSEQHPDTLEVGGDYALAAALLAGLHGALFRLGQIR